MLDTIYNYVYTDSMEMRIRDIPEELHIQFKIMCAEKRISMNKLMIQLMREAVEKHRKEKL